MTRLYRNNILLFVYFFNAAARVQITNLNAKSLPNRRERARFFLRISSIRYCDEPRTLGQFAPIWAIWRHVTRYGRIYAGKTLRNLSLTQWRSVESDTVLRSRVLSFYIPSAAKHVLILQWRFSYFRFRAIPMLKWCFLFFFPAVDFSLQFDNTKDRGNRSGMVLYSKTFFVKF